MTNPTAENKALVLKALDEIMGNKDVSAVDRYFREPYLQHNPSVPSGLAPLRGLAESLGRSATFRYERFRALADGDLVAVHGRYTGWQPQPVIALDLFRLENGKIVEHWDALQPEAAVNPSGHTMTDGPNVLRDSERTDANRALVRDFVDSVLLRGQMDRLPSYFDGDAYTQHNPQVGDGLSGFGAFLKAIEQKGIRLRFTKLHRVVAEGNFVLTRSEGTFGGKATAFCDLFRVDNGKIAEHWDVVQEIPATSESGLGMF